MSVARALKPACTLAKHPEKPRNKTIQFYIISFASECLSSRFALSRCKHRLAFLEQLHNLLRLSSFSLLGHQRSPCEILHTPRASVLGEHTSPSSIGFVITGSTPYFLILPLKEITLAFYSLHLIAQA